MKAVALILALAVITGCNARDVQQAVVPVSNWEDKVEPFWRYISELTQKADGVMQDIKDIKITNSMAQLSTHKEEIQTELHPYAESSTGQLSQDLLLLVNKLQKDIKDAKEACKEFLGELKTMIEHNSDDVHYRISAYTNKLKKRLNMDIEEIRVTVAAYLGEVHSHTAQKLNTVKGHVEPYISQASDTANKKQSDISMLKNQGLGQQQLETQAKNIKTQLETQSKDIKTQLETQSKDIKTQLETQSKDIKTQLETQSKDIKTQLEITAQELRTSLDSKIEQLTELFSPLASQVRQHFQSLVEAVKESQASQKKD